MFEILTITEAARACHVTRQAIYVAIKNKRLKAFKHDVHWMIKKDDLHEYQQGKYSRLASKRPDGSLLYDRSKNEYSVHQLAKIFNCSPQRLYYLVRTGRIKTERVGAAHIVKVDDLDELKNMAKCRA